GGLSPAVDAPTRPFSIRGWRRWRQHRAAFGPWHGELQHKSDPFLLARSVDPDKVPYLFLTCGEQDSLLPTNQQFSRLLRLQHFQFEYDFGPGSHDWNQWNSRLPKLFESLNKHLARSQ
ncbi:MAG TPA: hypothetical protein VLK33_06355, partial [Terriglobales bacterium]|nr:hypothetical protein [Terriglobales bacterium]